MLLKYLLWLFFINYCKGTVFFITSQCILLCIIVVRITVEPKTVTENGKFSQLMTDYSVAPVNRRVFFFFIFFPLFCFKINYV